MRTLTRPMFNMGGPIKQGVMHGIREPYAQGTRAALVGNPLYPKTGGREHHVAPIAYGIGAGLLHGARAAAPWIARQSAKYLKPLFGKHVFKKSLEHIPQKMLHKGATGQVYTGVASKWKPTWLGRDPIVKGAGWAASKAPIKKLFGFATSPSTLAGGAIWYWWPDGTKRQTPPPKGIIGPPGGGDPGMTYTAPESKPTVQSKKELDALAMIARNKRIKKYLDLMGYDRSKKTAIADALIDASKIVSERGTLDPKNITKELINPIIQATSKRLDKPQQIREAVGLMMTKAGLEKEMYEAKPGTVLKNVQDMVKSGKFTEDEAWAYATKEPGSASELILAHMGSKRGKLSDEYITTLMRSYGEDKNLPGKVITSTDMLEEYGKDTKKHPSAIELITEKGITDDGIYQVGAEVIQIIDGKLTQIK